MDYSELGAYLRQEREDQGLSLEDIQQKTKIGISSLEAIEAGRINGLPHPVYAKGFIKNYAQCLGLNAEEWAGAFAQQVGIDEEMDDDAEHLEQDLASSREKSKWPLISILISIVLLAAVTWLAYDLFWASAGERQDTSATSSAVSSQQNQSMDQVLEEQRQADKGKNSQAEEAWGAEEKSKSFDEAFAGEETVGQEAAVEVAGDDGKIVNGSSQTTESGRQDIESTSGQGQALDGEQAIRSPEAAQEAVAGDVRTEQSGQGTQATPAIGKHVLQIQASEACWMSAKIDAKQRDIYLRPGESVTFRFKDSLELKLGNAGGVSLSYDGKAYLLDADSGDVLSLTFP
jgi:cytoskeleton protein RodZ